MKIARKADVPAPLQLAGGPAGLLVIASLLLAGAAEAAKPKETAPAGPRELRVAADGSGDYKKLSKALRAAKPGDILLISKPTGMVGLELKPDADGIVAARAMPGSPAERAGLKPGDRVLKIDGVEAKGTLAEQVARVRGPVGTTVTLTIAPADGGSVRDVAITRGVIRYEIKDAATKLGIAVSESEPELAHELALPLAEGGLPYAQVLLAFNYVNGTGVKRNPKKALEWAQKAAESGNPAGQRLLGHLYYEGNKDKIVKPDASRFVYWTRKAAEGGDPPAMINYSWIHEAGYQVPQDLRLALDWARKAESSPLADSMVKISAQGIIARLLPKVPDAPKAPVAAAPTPASAPAAVDELAALPPARPADPKAVAVVIGVERHRESLPKADFAAADARRVAEYFKRVLGVTDENLALLVDERATKGDFEKYLEQWLPNHVEEGSKVYVYFSGHGAPEPAKGDSYLVPYDADPAYLKQTGYPLKRLYAALGKLPSKRVVVAMDSCFSGAGGRSVVAKGARPLVTVKTEAAPANITVLAASAGDQISNSYQEKGHGLFTYYLLKGLSEKGGDFRAAFDYLAPEVARTARRRYNADQTPQWRQGP